RFSPPAIAPATEAPANSRRPTTAAPRSTRRARSWRSDDNVRFLRPDLAWWLLAAFAAILILRWRARRAFAASTTVTSIDRASRASFLRGLPFVTLAAALVLTGLALMDP